MNIPANTGSQTAPTTDQETLVLGDLVRLFIDQIWWIIGITAVVFLLALAYVTVATPIYSADSLVQVEQQDSSSTLPGISSAAGSFGGATLPTEAEMQVMKSRRVLAPVVHDFKLEFVATPNVFPILGRIAQHFHKPGNLARPWFGLNSYAWGGEILDLETLNVPSYLENQPLMLTVLDANRYQLSGKDGGILLTGTVGTAAQGNGVTVVIKKLLANPGTKYTLVRSNELDAINGFASGLTIAEMGKQTGVVQISRNGADPALTASMTNAVARSYLEQHVEEKQAEASRMLDFLNGELPRLKADLEAAEAKLSAYQKQSGSFQPSTEANLYLQGQIQYEQQIAQLKLQEAGLLQRYTREHPMVIAIENQIAQTTAQKNVFEQRFRDIPNHEVNALGLQRDAKVSEDIYVAVLNKLQELSLTRAGQLGNVRILDQSLTPSDPIKPKKGLIEIASIVLGLIVGMLFVFTRKMLLVGIEDPDAIESKIGLPMLGAVPLNAVQLRWDSVLKRNSGARREILARSLPKDPAVEALRSFRTSLQFSLLDAPNKIVSFSGPVPGTGKSFVSVNIATLLAEAGMKVLLIDADMRRGHLNDYFNAQRGPGLSELLAGKVDSASVINSTDITGLSTIWTGAIPDNPAELLTGPRAAAILTGLESSFDIVLIDTPPVLAVTDASIISAIAGSSLLVFRSGMHSEREVTYAIKKLTSAGARVVGGVFNAIPSRVAKAGKYGGGNYHYVYQYDSEAK